MTPRRPFPQPCFPTLRLNAPTGSLTINTEALGADLVGLPVQR